ncbi:MAG: hypothetical protein J6X70_00830 [Muribaculaceae bacterium]|nr:hypothetical protein [Muribaculaceae bacterium]
MKTRVKNIKPQEVTKNGERSVRYKGSDGKMHDFSAKLPEDAAIPFVQREVIPAGTEITLAQAHAIEDFDFKKVTKLYFNEHFSIYSSFEVNIDEYKNQILKYAYNGRLWWQYVKEEENYVPFIAPVSDSVEENYSDSDQGKAKLAEILLEIAQQTGKLEIYNWQGPSGEQFLVKTYENAIILKIGEDLVYNEQFFIEKHNNQLTKIGLPKNAAIPAQKQKVISAGTLITLEQAKEITNFSFDKVGSLNIDNIDEHLDFIINLQQNGDRYLEANYRGQRYAKFGLNEGIYFAFNQHNTDTTEQQINNSELAEIILAIAKQTGELSIWRNTGANIVEYNDLNSIIYLTISEDIILDEYFAIDFNNKSYKLATLNEEEQNNENNGSSPVLVVHVTETQEGSVTTYEVDTSHDEVYEALGNGIMPLYIMKHIFKEDGCDDVITFSQMKIESATADVIKIADMNSGVEYNHVNQTVALYEP